MKRKMLAVILVLCLLIACSSCSKDAPKWNGFRGVNWGATKDEIIKAEGKKPIHGEVPYTFKEPGQVATYLPFRGSVSKYTNAVIYYHLMNNHLIEADYCINLSPDTYSINEEYDYLKKALTDTYGDESDKGLSVIQNFLEKCDSTLDGVDKYNIWFVDKTAIILVLVGSTVTILYLDSGYSDYLNKSTEEPQETDKINNSGL